MPKVAYSFKLDTNENSRVIRWLEEQTNKSDAIRDVLTEHVTTSTGVSLGDIYQAVKDLERKMRAGSVAIQANRDEDWHEDPDLAAALTSLGNLS